MTKFHFKSALGAVSALALLAGCGGDSPASTPATVDTETALTPEAPPVGQLPEGVTPTAYKIDLVLDPAEDNFSGTVVIDVDLDTDHQRIWLHSLGPIVNEVYATTADGSRVDATFTSDLADGGVSKIDFATALPAGSHKLTIAYDAPYNRNLAGLYRACLLYTSPSPRDS